MRKIFKGQSPTSHKATTGQSMVEVVVAVGLVILVTSGVVALLVNVLGARTKSFDRRKATELAQKVVETIVADKNQKGEEFWQGLTYFSKYGSNATDPLFPDYRYNVTASQDVASPNCGGGYKCVEATVTVGWASSSDTVVVSRYFSKY